MNINNLQEALMEFEKNTLMQEKCKFESGNARKYNKYSDNIVNIAK
jgi:hypothetical protein